MLEIIEITKIEQSLTVSLKTRYHNYNSIKNHIASLYSTMNIQRVEPTRHISQFLNIPKSIVSRVLLQLEEDKFISKVSMGSHPKHNWYIVAVSKQECFLFRNFISLSRFKKKKFLMNLQTIGAKSIDDIVKINFGMGYSYYCSNNLDSKAIG